MDRLHELIAEKGFASTGHPRSLAMTLLSDWVFTQHPKSVREVFDVALNGGGFRLLLAASGTSHRSTGGITLPRKCGGDLLLDRCFEILRCSPPSDYASRVAETARTNATPDELRKFWVDEIPGREEKTVGEWLWLGNLLGVLQGLTAGEISQLFSGRTLDRRFLTMLMHVSRADFVEADEARCAVVAASALDCHYSTGPGGEGVLEGFATSLDPARYARAFEVSVQAPLAEVWKRDESLALPGLHVLPARAQQPTLYKCLSTVEGSNAAALRPASEWASQLGPWNDFVESCRSLWGDHLSLFFLANVAAGIRSSAEKANGFPDLLDGSKPLCLRSRYARLRAGSAAWWQKQVPAAKASGDQLLVALILLTWGSSNTLVALFELLQPILDSLTTDDWHALFRCLRRSLRLLQGRTPRVSFAVQSLPGGLLPRTVVALAARTRASVARELYDRYLSSYKGADPYVLDFCQEQALDSENIRTGRWKPNLEQVALAYARGVVSHPYHALGPRAYYYAPRAKVTLCESIVADAERFPMQLVAHAEAICRDALASKIVPVAEVAKKETWFAEPEVKPND